jgi:Zn-dependent protease with chaperone function
MSLSRRSQALLFTLGFVAGANGLLVGISLYGVFAAALHILGYHAPGIGWAVLAGAIGAIALIARSFRRADQTRKRLYGASLLDYEVPEHARLLDRVAQLTRNSSLSKAPGLRLTGGDLPNAYTVSRSRDEAAIVITRGLLEHLAPAERDAVIAHELANVENEDVAAVGFADAIAVSIEELARLKGRFFWGPREILVDLFPFIGAIAGLAILDRDIARGRRQRHRRDHRLGFDRGGVPRPLQSRTALLAGTRPTVPLCLLLRSPHRRRVAAGAAYRLHPVATDCPRTRP